MPKEPYWSEEEMEFLSDKLGLMTHGEIGKALSRVNGGHERTYWAVKMKAWRLGLKYFSNVYSQTLLASELGVSRRVIRKWFMRSWLRGKMSSWVSGYGNRVMLFTQQDIEKFLKAHADRFEGRKIPNVFFRNLVESCLKERNA